MSTDFNSHPVLEALIKASMSAVFSSNGQLDQFSQRSLAPNDLQTDFINIMFSVAGLHFRMACLLHINTKLAPEHFQPAQSNSSNTTEQAMYAYFTEMGNQYCGEIKRHFHSKFESLGMSTPQRLSTSTLIKHFALDDLKTHGFFGYFTNDRMIIGSSLFLYSKENVEFSHHDFDFSSALNTGELEFF